MGFRFSRRIGDKVGLNFSRSGVSASIRTGIGAFSTQGFTLHTGFRGLTYRGTWFSGRIFPARSVFSVGGVLNVLFALILLAVKITIILLVLFGLLIFSIGRLLFHLVSRFRKPAAAPEHDLPSPR